MKFIFILLGSITYIFATVPSFSFIGLNDANQWQIIICHEKNCKTIQTQEEPRTYDYNFSTGDVVYIGSDKNVHIIQDKQETVLLESKKNAYTEPSFIHKGKEIMLVQLINGNSKKTKIITINPQTKKIHTLHSQHSTALEPYTNNNQDLYFANVSCVEGCNKIIQEIWHKNLITKEANQLTLQNVLSHQPRANKNNTKIYFSSIKDGNYHIYRYDIREKISQQLTFGESTDGFPSPSEDGILFIRRVSNKLTLMQLSIEGKLKEISLSTKYKKIRNLKVKQ